MSPQQHHLLGLNSSFQSQQVYFIQKCHLCTGNLNSETSGDNKHLFLHCGNVLADNTAVAAFMARRPTRCCNWLISPPSPPPQDTFSRLLTDKQELSAAACSRQVYWSRHPKLHKLCLTSLHLGANKGTKWTSKTLSAAAGGQQIH